MKMFADTSLGWLKFWGGEPGRNENSLTPRLQDESNPTVEESVVKNRDSFTLAGQDSDSDEENLGGEMVRSMIMASQPTYTPL